MPSPLEEPLPEEKPAAPVPTPPSAAPTAPTPPPVPPTSAAAPRPPEQFLKEAFPPTPAEGGAQGAPLEMPPEKPSKLKWVFIFIILVAVIAGGFFTYQKGYLNFILSKFTRLPSDPLKALELALNSMSQVSSFHIEGEIILQVPSQQETTSGNLSVEVKGNLGSTTSETKTQNSTVTTSPATTQLSGSWDMDVQGSDLKGSFGIETKDLPQSLITLYPALKNVQSVKLNYIVKDNVLYYQPPSLKEATSLYRKFDFSKTQTSSEIQNLITPGKIDLSWLKQNYSSGKKGKDEKIDGVACASYQIELASLKTIGQQANLTFSFWIGKKDQMLHQIKYLYSAKYAGQDFSADMSGKFSGFGQEVTITAPKEEEVTTGSILDVLKGQITAKTDDPKRKSDLLTIKGALKEYKAEQGSFPVSKDLVKTNDSKSVLATALVPNYISKLPVDPQDPKYYYGYKSDGETFELSAVLENKDDPEGQKIGDKTIYILKND